jgi:hypothetical protein
MTKIKAVFVKKLGTENFEEYKTKKIKETDEIISIDNKTFIIPKGIYSMKRGKTIELYFDWENEKMLFFKEHGVIFDAKFLDKVLSKGIIAQLVAKLRSSMEKTDKFSLLGKLVIPILCLVVGYFAGKLI